MDAKDIENKALRGYIKAVCAEDLAMTANRCIQQAVDRHVSIGMGGSNDDLCCICGKNIADFTLDWIEEPESGSTLQLAGSANNDVLATDKKQRKVDKEYAYNTKVLNRTKARQIEEREKWFRRIKNVLLNKKEK